jgi:hypothetical protein
VQNCEYSREHREAKEKGTRYGREKARPEDSREGTVQGICIAGRENQDLNKEQEVWKRKLNTETRKNRA